MPAAAHEFVVDGLEFTQKSLKLRDSLAAEALVLEAVIPPILALRGLAHGGVDILPALAGLKHIDQLVDLFAPACQVRRGDLWVALPAFLDVTFERRNAALLTWLCECVEWQFADFFGGAGLQLLQAKANHFISRILSTGGSGE